jgi:hypothetical protein
MLTLENPIRLSSALRIGGLDYRAASRPQLSRKHGRKAKRLGAMYLMVSLPLDLWLVALTSRALDPTMDLVFSVSHFPSLSHN